MTVYDVTVDLAAIRGKTLEQLNDEERDYVDNYEPELSACDGCKLIFDDDDLTD